MSETVTTARPTWPKHYRRDWIVDGPANAICADCLYCRVARGECGWTLKLNAPASQSIACGLFEPRCNADT